MDQQRICIDITWDRDGRITYGFSGPELPSSEAECDLLLLAPSAALFFCSQLGELRPSCGLQLCRQVIDISLGNSFVPSAVNPALKAMRLVYEQIVSGLIAFRVRPTPPVVFIAGDTELAEGTAQLAVNHFHAVLRLVHEFHQHRVKTMALETIDSYYELLGEQLLRGKIGPNRDAWNPDIHRWSSDVLRVARTSGFGFSEMPSTDDTHWRTMHLSEIQEKCTELLGTHQRLCRAMGIA